MKNLFYDLPVDIQDKILRFCFCFRSHFQRVMSELDEKYFCMRQPTIEFLESLNVDDQIRFRSDFGWKTVRFRGFTGEFFYNLPFYHVANDYEMDEDGPKNLLCDKVWSVNPMREVSQIVLRSNRRRSIKL